MRKDIRLSALLCSLLLAALAPYLQAQEPTPAGRMPDGPSGGVPVAIGAKISTLGPGLEIGVGLTKRVNLRVGGSYFNYDTDAEAHAVNYIRLHSLEAHVDWFPFGGKFHVGPGILYYLTDLDRAKVSVVPGQSFSLGGTAFYSSYANPVTGSASTHVNHIAPAVTAGFGNLLPRKAGKHWSVPFEFGFAYQGAPKLLMGLQGTACDINGFCYDAATDPHVLGPLQQEIRKRESDVSWLRFYPIVSIGVGYRF